MYVRFCVTTTETKAKTIYKTTVKSSCSISREQPVASIESNAVIFVDFYVCIRPVRVRKKNRIFQHIEIYTKRLRWKYSFGMTITYRAVLEEKLCSPLCDEEENQ